MTKPHERMNRHLSQEEGITKSISVIAIIAAVVVIGALSFSISHTANAERDFSKCTSGEEEGTNNCQKQQSKAFDRCIEKARQDGELTDQEYFTCAYSIYA